jgi:predicted ATP-binding protein involved in virulence
MEKLKEKQIEQDKTFSELREAALPLIKYLSEKHHPHVTAIVTSTSVELVEGIMNIPKIYDFLK